jgi:hypothetical protein
MIVMCIWYWPVNYATSQNARSAKWCEQPVCLSADQANDFREVPSVPSCSFKIQHAGDLL